MKKDDTNKKKTEPEITETDYAGHRPKQVYHRDGPSAPPIRRSPTEWC